MRELEGRIAVVTGGNTGIGRAIALSLGEHGASVVIAGRHHESLCATQRELVSRGIVCLSVPCDVTDPSAIDVLATAVLDRFGSVDVVVANAGVAGPTKSMQDISLEEWRGCLATDLDGVFLTFRQFLPAMIRRRTGSLIAISSMTGKRPLAGRTPYAAAKMGVIGLVRTLALEVGPLGIRVNAVCPGAVEGPRIAGVIEEQARAQGISEEDARAQFTEPAALRRLVRAADVAAACVFLASDASASVTGEDMNVTAGLVMY